MCEDVHDDARVALSVRFIISNESEKKKKNLSITTKTSAKFIGNSSLLKNNHFTVYMLR